MRCIACDCLLTDFEATRKSVNTNQYLDLCNTCYYTINDDVLALERADLQHDEDTVLDSDNDTLLVDGIDNLEEQCYNTTQQFIEVCLLLFKKDIKMLSISEFEEYEYETTLADVVFFIKQRGWDTVLKDIIDARNSISFKATDTANTDSPF